MKGGFDSDPWCKDCGHEYKIHKESRTRAEKLIWKTFGYEVIGCNTGPWCKCKQFVATDNLTFVEWLARKRNLV